MEALEISVTVCFFCSESSHGFNRYYMHQLLIYSSSTYLFDQGYLKVNKTNDLILSLTPENMAQQSRVE